MMRRKLTKRKFLFPVVFVCLAVAVLALFVVPNSGSSLQAADSGWHVRCGEGGIDSPEPKRGRCEVFQRLLVQETSQRLIELAIGFPEDKKEARGVFVLPLGIRLADGVLMRVDEGRPIRVQIRHCEPNGCVAYLSLDKKILKSFREGELLEVAFVSADGQNLKVPMSLIGLTKSLEQVS